MKLNTSETAGQADELNLILLVSVNTEEELSYVDRVLYEVELKISAGEYGDQREK